MENFTTAKSSEGFQDWDTFVSQYWQKEPVVLHDTVLSSADDIFQTVILACEKYCAQEEGVYLKLYVNGKQILQDLPQYLPHTEDGSPKGYEQRLQRELNAESFILFITGFERYNAKLYHRAQDFLSHLFQHTGIPAGHAELELFLGRYTYTPGGIHKEECTNFQWVIDGDKTMHTWPESTWNTETLSVNLQHDPTSHEEEYFLEDVSLNDTRHGSKALRGKAGDILYWPSKYWHVGETPELSMAITLAIYMHGRPYQEVLQTVQQLVEQHIGSSNIAPAYPFPTSTNTSLESALPASLHQPFAIIKELTSTRLLQQALLERWLKRASNLSLSKTLELLPEKVFTEAESIHYVSPRPILYTQLDPQTFLYAANGHCATINTEIHLAQLLDFLNTGATITISNALAQYSPMQTARASTELHQIITFLYRAYAISVE
ncbi:cupin domain-containing protein [Dictyobacter arantiisoli]|uniref:Uncharacterized protein n=1 Tax=Dictyobacter arantiisoli TaxID=2014874 RepID=A0A5A5TG93_9CHLR|nr:cupin domain-containing protein [Dictyobacter arantiisoli]GCF10362.1 hypothetical protein KDI_39260 [Dictyobacter arantiisoli]